MFGDRNGSIDIDTFALQKLTFVVYKYFCIFLKLAHHLMSFLLIGTNSMHSLKQLQGIELKEKEAQTD